MANRMYRYGFRLAKTIAIAIVFAGCTKTKYTQCEQIFNIARQITSSSTMAYTSQKQAGELKTWLEAAKLMDTAARQLEALPIEDLQLNEYKTKLASVYQIYGEATLDAVKAREFKNLDALKSARDRARSASKLQQEAVTRINAYCLNDR